MDFVLNDFLFFVQFLLRKSAFEDHISNQFRRTSKISLEKAGMDDGFLFSGVGIELATHIIQSRQYVVCLAFFSAFEEVVFDKMCQSLLMFKLVSRACFDGHSHVCDGTFLVLKSTTQAVRQGEAMGVWHYFSSMTSSKVRNASA